MRWQWADEKMKRMSWIDMQLMKGSCFFLGLFVASLFLGFVEKNKWLWLVLFILFAIKPLYQVWIKKDTGIKKADVKRKNKKGALELSVGTIVIIVLAMTMLIFGFVLVKSIFTGATDSVDTLNEKTRNEISKLFTDESKNVVVFLGSDQKAKIRVGTEDFGIGIGAKTSDGSTAVRTRMKYKISLSDAEKDSCVKEIGEKNTLNLIKQRTEEWIEFDEMDGDNVYAIVSITIPKGTVICTQKILIDVKDTETDMMVGGASFTIELLKTFF